MEKRDLYYFLALGFGLLFLLPATESIGGGLNKLATFLVLGYWGMMGLSFLLFIFKNIFAEFGFNHMVYNLWLFLSLMCVAIGILAIVDEGIDKARWAVGLIVYGGAVGFLNRNEL